MKPKISKHELSEFLIKKYGNEVDWEKISEGMESSVLAFTWKGEEYILRVINITNIYIFFNHFLTNKLSKEQSRF